ncbi:MAG: UbiX family flavin prenyltransferase [Spirochaetia bacterium]|nr:UbiX family flavin prenyltransferase [Spirochaetia bacterium]
MNDKNIKLIVASTGGSGSGYLMRLFYHLLSVSGETHWMASDNFFTVMDSEYGFNFANIPFGICTNELTDKLSEVYSINKKNVYHKFYRHDYRDISAAPSSGSVFFDAMIVLPCSMKTLGAIAGGVSSNLIERSADVSLKERRKLILVPRETPYNLIHLENMRLLTLANAVILPASPGFYHHPETLNDIYDFIVDRLFAHVGIEKRAIKAWDEK